MDLSILGGDAVALDHYQAGMRDEPQYRYAVLGEGLRRLDLMRELNTVLLGRTRGEPRSPERKA
jgi:hypothetical protein